MAQRSTSTQVGYVARRDSSGAAWGNGEDVSVRLRRLAERASAKVLRGEQRVIARSDPTSLARPCAIALPLTGFLAPGGGDRVEADSRLAKV
jgi:hypothetical protein